jgi:hypothetical protein
MQPPRHLLYEILHEPVASRRERYYELRITYSPLGMKTAQRGVADYELFNAQGLPI